MPLPINPTIQTYLTETYRGYDVKVLGYPEETGWAEWSVDAMVTNHFNTRFIRLHVKKASIHEEIIECRSRPA